MLRRAVLLLSCLLIAAAPTSAPLSGYQKIKPSLALIGYPTDDKKYPIAFGTGFCVTTTPSKSYFVTANHVVTGSLGNIAADLFLIFPKSPDTRHKAAVVRRSVDTDLAIVSVDMPCDGTVQLSRVKPEQPAAIEIAGFPFVETCRASGLCGDAQLASHAHKGILGVFASSGHVQDSEGDFDIFYDAKTDHGNSGGPLYDPETGAVYGIVIDEIPGYSADDVPSQVSYDRAVATIAGLPFINSAPVAVALDAGVGGARGGSRTDRYSDAALGSALCRAAWRTYDKAYGDWAQAHGGVASLVAYFAVPEHASRKSHLQPLAAHFVAREGAALAQLRSSADAMRVSGATTIIKPATALADVVAGITTEDASAAGSLGSAPSPDAKSAGRLEDAVEAMDSVIACI